MATIARRRLGSDLDPTPRPLADRAPWHDIARLCTQWAADEAVALRDCVMVLPFAQLLPQARAAFAAAGGWMPRVETTQTLAASLAPPASPTSGQLSFDAALDALVALQTLARQPWAAEWSRRDRRGFERAAARLVDTAHDLARAAARTAPPERDAFFESARAAARPPAGPAAVERVLAQLAIEWAALAPTPVTDALFALSPAAWIVVEAGGGDPLMSAIVAAATGPALLVETDPPLAEPFGDAATMAAPALAVCDSFEDEAAATAAQVLDHVGRGECPVALIAQDRSLVRRVRALLERHGVGLRDETGWKLSTTRAGASVMSLLVAARPGASTDAFFDWIKGTAGVADGRALARLETTCRRLGVDRIAGLAAIDLDPSVAARCADALSILQRLGEPARRPLTAWLDALVEALERSGALGLLGGDPAGRQVLEALSIVPPMPAARRRQLEIDLDALVLADFTRWVDDVLERRNYLPPDAGADDRADDRDAADVGDAGGDDASTVEVVVTPLARAMLRPFAAVVIPGADDEHLGRLAAVDSLFAPDVAEALGLPTAAARRDAELIAFAQALRLPRMTLLRRRGDGAEPLSDSPFVERLRLALAPGDLRAWVDPRRAVRITPAPVVRSAPSVGREQLPGQLSATAYEALRDCPYRFFARSVLGLREDDELDAEVGKRDYGSWLHEVLDAFHATRAADPAARSDRAASIARLHALGEESRARAGLDAADFVPFSASFAAFVPRYVDWLAAREERGTVWLRGEAELRVAPAELAGIELCGRVDRIDTVRGRSGPGLELIDYKTGSVTSLKDKVRDRSEDTQLAFYAALVGPQSELPLTASYLALDATSGIEAIAHEEVEASAAALVAAVAGDMRRLAAGAPMRPLGEGKTCGWCEARGLCRRDHWSEAATASTTPERPAPEPR